MNTTISVDNLPACCTVTSLCAMFDAFGPVQIMLASDRTGRHLGFAFITCYSPAAAADAIATLDGTDMMGHRIRVSPVISLTRHVDVVA
jgi:RNA recognition motif-containing protein